jgi:4-amino-4-deoxy-L-arabinose transferase-like glycosyltransferase
MFMHRYSKQIRIVLILVILAIGAYLRLHKISEYMTFLGDEGRDVLVVKHIIVDHKFTLLGPTASVGGFFLGPIYYYFMVPFLWVWKLDPVGPAVMVALFGIATIYLVYRIGRDFFSESVGLIAAALYAVSPLVVAYSRSSWNPNPVPFFACVVIYLLWYMAVYQKWHLLFFLGIAVGMGLQLHYLFLFLCPVVLIWMVWHRLLFYHVKYYLYGLGGFILGYSPFLAFEVRHGFPNTVSIIEFISKGKDTGFVGNTFLYNVIDVSTRLFGRLVYRMPEVIHMGEFPSWQVGLWVWGSRAVAVVAVIMFIRHIQQIKKLGNKLEIPMISILEGNKLLLLWGVIVVILFGLYRRAIYDYYFGIVFPLPFLISAIALASLARRNLLRYVSIMVIAGLLYLNWQGRPFLYTPNNQLAQMKRIAQETVSHTEGKPFNFALITGQNSDHAYRYFFEIWGNPPVTIENSVIDPERKTVTNQLMIICETVDCQPLGNSLWEVAGFGRAEIIGKWQVPFVTIYKLTHYKEPS